MSQQSGPRRDLGDGSGRTALVDGSTVGGYQLSYLASGGMSIVYKGEKLGKTVVLKEVQSSNTREVPSLISEKTLLERLQHPGLVTYHSFFSENGYYYLVVEYVPGVPLSHFLSGTPPGVEEIADWAVQLCEIFDYLHNQSPPIIYRDLKSENILLHDGQIKLIDFGIARLHKGDRKNDTELMGSPVTASPEHYGGAETDGRSDIYTLGATIYELLTSGRRKQVGAFQFAPVRELRPDVPVALEKVIAKSLEFKPEARFQTALEFRDAILTALGRPIPAAQDRRTRSVDESPAPSPQKRRPWLLLTAICGLLVLVGAAVSTGKLSFGGDPGVVKSTGSHEASLQGKLFGSDDVEGKSVVFMGEDVGLFQVSSWEKQSAKKRAETLAKRLNIFYKSPCPSCGATALEPRDIKVGRYTATGDTVVFYAHLHGFDELHWDPMVLATVDKAQAASFGTTEQFVATYWRDLMRDTIALSRGFPVEHSALGTELTEAMTQARAQLKPDDTTVAAMRKILSKTTGSQSLKLRSLFARIPEQKSANDDFGGVKGFEPLR